MSLVQDTVLSWATASSFVEDTVLSWEPSGTIQVIQIERRTLRPRPFAPGGDWFGKSFYRNKGGSS